MRTYKYTIYVTLPLTIISLTIALLLYRSGSEFVANVFLGIFGSSFLALLTGIINYFIERQKTLEAFWSYGHKVVRNFNRYSTDEDLESAIDILMQMREYDYQPFDDAFGAICFLFNNKRTRHEIWKRLYEPIMEVRKALNSKYHHFKMYKKAANGNRVVMEEFVSEIDQLLIKRETVKLPMEDGTNMTGIATSTFKVHQLYLEFNDYFFFVMYPWKKGDATETAD